MKLSILVLTILAMPAFAQVVPPQTCTPGPNGTCMQQSMGDTDNSVDNSQSEATQVNPSSNTNGGDVNQDIDTKVQATQNATTTTGPVSADASGNVLDSDNRSSANAGQSNTGNSSAATGAINNASGVGDTSASTGPVTTSAAGGAGGNAAGGAGGSTGPVAADATGGQVAGSGNSRVGPVSGGDSAARSTGGNQKQASLSGANAAGGTSGGNVIDTRNQSSSVSNVSYRTQYVPQLTQPAIPVAIAGSPLQFVTASCGPRLRRVTERMDGQFFGLAKTKHFDLGPFDRFEEDEQRPYREVIFPDGTRIYYGHQPLTTVSVNTTSGARSLGGGGGSDSGKWGQLGLTSASGTQQQQHVVTLAECELMRTSPAPVFVERAPEPPKMSPVKRKPVFRARKPFRGCDDPKRKTI